MQDQTKMYFLKYGFESQHQLKGHNFFEPLIDPGYILKKEDLVCRNYYNKQQLC